MSGHLASPVDIYSQASGPEHLTQLDFERVVKPVRLLLSGIDFDFHLAIL